MCQAVNTETESNSKEFQSALSQLALLPHVDSIGLDGFPLIGSVVLKWSQKVSNRDVSILVQVFFEMTQAIRKKKILLD